ncbi:MAG TPA: hypothetical protein VFA89_02540 [Terriglobales bacterium]|nr:hypothetical protein [Terriglobales bacterium]
MRLIVVFAFLMVTQGVLTAADKPPQGTYPWEDFWKVENRLTKGRPYMESYILHGKRQLFVDNYIVEHMDNLERVLHQPVRYAGNPVLMADQPWEVQIAWVNVIYDDEEHTFRAWYQIPAGLCYAISKDGIHWDKPILNLVEYKGSKANNIVISGPGKDSPTVLKDPLARDAQHRYVYFAKHNAPKYGMYVGYSADGIHWTVDPEPVLTPVDDPTLNDRPNFMIDSAKKRYVGLTKSERANPFGYGDWGMFQRMKAITFSDDLHHWTKPVVILKPDDRDPPTLQIYGMMGFNYEGMYLGLADIFHSQDSGPNAFTVDVQLALSRNGEDWWRAGNRQTFFGTGPENAWDRYRVYEANTPPISVGNELWFYYRGDATRHTPPAPEWRQGPPWFAHIDPAEPLPSSMPASGMGLAKLRRDGFISVDAGARPGRLLTRPLIFDGTQLHVNANANGGFVRAELYLAEKKESNYGSYSWAIGDPIPGFSLSDCEPFRADSTNSVLQWKGGSLDRFAGQYVVIRFELVNASLYSFWLE